eukprot:NP_494460.2 Uncharacterized protein CELE_T10D4.1 [Caenorhabditis elegans]
MKQYLIFLLLICYVACEDEYGCEDDCECPSFLDLITNEEHIFYTENAGCNRNATCVPGTHTTIAFRWRESEIPKPDDDTVQAVLGTAGPFDIFTQCGVICENNEWYITKYPRGAVYRGSDFSNSLVEEDTVNGLKSKVFFVLCLTNTLLSLITKYINPKAVENLFSAPSTDLIPFHTQIQKAALCCMTLIMIKFIIFSAILIGAILGAPLASDDDIDNVHDCSVRDKFFRLYSTGKNCSKGMSRYHQCHQDTSSTRCNYYLKQCDEYMFCQRNGECEIEYQGGVKTSVCPGVEINEFDFKECLVKLLANKVRSECLVSWDPFMQRSGGDVCGAFFGSAACMKKEITETCGEADWRMVRKYVARRTPEIRNCVSYRLQ